MEKRARGTVFGKRSSIYCEHSTYERIAKAGDNPSAFLDRESKKKYPDDVDPLLIKMQEKFENLQKELREKDTEVRLMAKALQAYNALKEEKLPLPDFNSSEATSSEFKAELKEIGVEDRDHIQKVNDMIKRRSME